MSSQPGLVVSLADAGALGGDLLGGKGAGLVRMRSLGLPVPPGFVITTEACRRYLDSGRLPDGLGELIEKGLAGLEAEAGRRFGDADAPLLVSVRSGAPVSMPGMMDTVLNVGLTDRGAEGLGALVGDEEFALRCYLRLLRAFATTVRRIPAAALPPAGDESSAGALRAGARDLLAAIEEKSGRAFPQDARAQLLEAVEAVFESWRSPRAVRYRRHAGIQDGSGTAAVVQAMVFGNMPGASGTGVAFTRDPATGAPQLYGDYLADAQGEDVVGGEHDVERLEECRRTAPDAYADLERCAELLERHWRDVCEIEFTVERGRLWVLQTRVAQRTSAAALRIALDLIAEGTIGPEEAVRRLGPAPLLRATDPVFDPNAPREVIGVGIAASPGAAAGRIALDSDRARELAESGVPVILVRPHTSPEDISGMIAARGIVTARGGPTSHAAVVARGLDRPAVCGVTVLEVRTDRARFGDLDLAEGDEISVDGSTGEVLRGSLPLVSPAPDPRIEELLAWCDERRRVPVLSEAGPAPWADAVLDAEDAAWCRTPEELNAALAAGERTLVIDPSEPEAGHRLLSRAAELGSDRRLLLRVEDGWPAMLKTPPGTAWAAVIAGERGRMAARLLAATVGPGS